MRSVSISGGLLSVLAATSVVCVSACGTSSSANSGAKVEAQKPATQILADAKSALFNAKAVHVAGTETSGGQSETIDFQFQGENSKGTVTAGGITEQIIKTGGSLYVNAPAAYWTKAAGAQGAALAGKWIIIPAAQAGDATQLTLQGVAASIGTSGSPLNPTTTVTKIGKTKAIVLTEKDGSTLTVADSTTPDPLQVTGKGTDKGQETFTDYGNTQPITAPAGAITAQQAAKSATTGT